MGRRVLGREHVLPAKLDKRTLRIDVIDGAIKLVARVRAIGVAKRAAAKPFFSVCARARCCGSCISAWLDRAVL
eukprot:794098-Lingulodinium_polyedra.AAC.1